MTLKLQINNKILEMFVCLACGMLCVQGCKKNDEHLQSTPSVIPPRIDASPKSSSKPVLKQLSSSVKMSALISNQFDFGSKKDPFKPYVIQAKPVANTYIKSKRATGFMLPIHSFDVSQFRLIGIISGGKDSQAMVVDPNGKGYVVKIGMTIGKNEGRVVSITPSGIDVLEQFRDDNGKLRKEHIKLSLPRK